MTAESTAVGASVLAHGLHLAMVLAGLWGLAALLLPHVLTRYAAAGASSYDEHAERVAALRAALVAGTGATVAAGARGHGGPAPTLLLAPASSGLRPAAPIGVLSVPLAIVGTATAAGIHAAVAPPHLREQALGGLFFLVTACAQLAWAGAATRPTPRLLRLGVVLNLGLVGLWLVTRTVGLPFGLLPQPHPVGAWDLTCVAWQVAAAAACAATLRHGVPHRCPGWFDWHPAGRAAVGAAAVLLVLLTLTGAHS